MSDLVTASASIRIIACVKGRAAAPFSVSSSDNRVANESICLRKTSCNFPTDEERVLPVAADQGRKSPSRSSVSSNLPSFGEKSETEDRQAASSESNKLKKPALLSKDRVKTL